MDRTKGVVILLVCIVSIFFGIYAIHTQKYLDLVDSGVVVITYLSQNAKRASARKDTGLDQSLFSVQLFRLRIDIMKVCKGSI